MAKLNLIQRTKKGLFVVALGVMFAQAAILLIPSSASAVESEKENGSCFPKSGYICGLNGHNYSNKAYQGN